nr:MAG TPA: hypothetical protein [Caudoviricetes sp.]
MWCGFEPHKFFSSRIYPLGTAYHLHTHQLTYGLVLG